MWNIVGKFEANSAYLFNNILIFPILTVLIFTENHGGPTENHRDKLCSVETL